MRFHVGMSFRPKQLLKWIIPILLGLGLFSLGDLKLAHASSQSQTQININTIDINNVSICDHALTDYINYFQASLGNKYNFIVTYNNGYYQFTFIPVVSGVFNLYSYSYMPKDYYDSQRPDLDNVSITFLKYGNNDLSLSQRDLILDSTFTLIANPNSCSNTNFLNSPIAQTSFENYMTAYATFRENGVQKPNMFNVINSTNLTGVYSGYGNQVFTNVSSQDDPSGEVYFEFDYSNYWENYLIYSNLSTIYSDDLSWYRFYNSTDYIIQPVYRNNELINNNDTLDYNYIFVPSFPTTYNNMGIFYFNVPKQDLNNINFRLSFTNSNIALYTSNVFANINYYGRIYHSDSYYTYEKLTCHTTQGYSINSSDNSAIFGFNTITCDESLSPYDNIIFSLSFYGDDDPVDKVVSNVNYSYTSGSVYRSNLYSDIYEPLTQLYRGHKIFLSTFKDLATGYLFSSGKWVVAQEWDTINWVSKYDTSYNQYNYFYPNAMTLSYTKELGLFIHQYLERTQDSIDYVLLFDYNSLLSINNNDNNTLYYYYSDGSIKHDDIILTYDNNNYSDDYDTDYYFSFISNYIDSISSDMIQFSTIVQKVYDSMPTLLQSIFFVLFILGNIFILLKLIRK